MADIKFTGEFDDKISPSLKRVQDEVKKTTSAFDSLKDKIAGIAFGAIISSAVSYAAAIDDVASSTGIAVENVVGFTKAFQQFGGSTEGAITGLAKFQNVLDDAAKGNEQAQLAFRRLGVGIDDLRKLSEQDLLRKTIQGLGEMGPGAERTAIAMQLLGRSAATVDFAGVNDNLDGMTEKSRNSAQAIRDAAAAEEKFGIAMGEFKVSLLAALQPIASFVSQLDPKAIEDFMKAMVEIGKAIAIFLIVDKVAGSLLNFNTALTTAGSTGNGFRTALAGVSSTALGATSSVGNLRTGVGGLVTLFGRMVPAGASFNDVMSSMMRNFGRIGAGIAGLLGGFGKLFAVLYAINGVVAGLTGNSLVDWAEKAAKSLGLINQTSKERQQALDDEKKKQDELAKLRDKEKKQGEDKRDVQLYYNKQLDQEKDKLDKAVVSYKEQAAAQVDKFKQQTRNLSLTEEQILAEENRAAAEEARAKAVLPLEEQIAAIKRKGKEATDLEKALLPELASRVAEINKLYKQNEPVRERELQERLRILNAVKEQAFNQDLMSKMTGARQTALTSQEDFDRQTRMVGLSEDQRIGVERLNAVQNNYLNGIRPLLEQHAQLQARIDFLRGQGNKNLQAEESQLAKIRQALQQLTGEYTNDLNVAKQSIEVRKQANDQAALELFQKNSLTTASQRLTALDRERAEMDMTPIEKQLFKIRNSYDDITKSALQAYAARKGIKPEEIPLKVQEQYRNVLSETAKKEQEKARANLEYQRSFQYGWEQAYRTYADAASNSANQAKNYFDIMSRGIEDSIVRFVRTGKLSFTDLANNMIAEYARMEAKALITQLMPKSGGGGFISDLFSTLGSAIFGGGRAAGGPVRAGMPYMVGERGAEMFVPGQNGTIIPKLGVEQAPPVINNVTYNINAVDAVSFKQMIARDPSFIYAVSQQGAKGVSRRY
jgi:lambda family phage tail tape measure protein